MQVAAGAQIMNVDEMIVQLKWHAVIKQLLVLLFPAFRLGEALKDLIFALLKVEPLLLWDLGEGLIIAAFLVAAIFIIDHPMCLLILAFCNVVADTLSLVFLLS